MIKTRITETEWAELEYRRNALFTHAQSLRCSACGTDQLQVVRWDTPAQWKCRLCKHRFTSEPASARQDAREP